MRPGAAILLSVSCFLVGIRCYSQDPCALSLQPKTDREAPHTRCSRPSRTALIAPR